jgi:hypothetical protein
MVLFLVIYVGKKIDNMLKQRRAFGPIGLSANPFQIVNLKEKTKHHSLLKTFYKLYLLDKKKNKPTIIIMDYWGEFGPPVRQS